MINKIDFPYFRKVRFINDKSEGIAKSQRKTHELVINLYYWKQMKPEHKFYILAHEEGHIFYDTRDELEADEYASKKYLNAGLKISESVKALCEHLDRKSPVHIARAWAQYQRALKFDYEHNHNQKAFRQHYESADLIKRKLQPHGTIPTTKRYG